LAIEDALRLREARPTEAIDHEPIDGNREPKSLDHRLTPLEREWFAERKLRFEINAIPARRSSQPRRYDNHTRPPPPRGPPGEQETPFPLSVYGRSLQNPENGAPDVPGRGTRP